MEKQMDIFNKTSITISLTASALILILFFALHGIKGKPDDMRFRDFLKAENDYYIYDSEAGHLHRDHAKRVFEWPEHPQGTIVMLTNNLGFREDNETLEEKPTGTVRVLVTGDSHTDGVIYNSESFANRLESRLNNGNTGTVYECLSGGVGHYGPQNYPGFLKRFLYLKPDVYVVVFYTGNDFLDAVCIDEFNKGRESPRRPAEYYQKMIEANKLMDGSVAQALNQLYFFKRFPGMEEKALAIAKTSMEETARLCGDNNIKLLVALLPTKLDIEPDTDAERINKANGILRLLEEDFHINRRLTESLAARLSELNIDHFDLYDSMKNNESELYWKADHHLNDKGHDLIAEIVYPAFR